MQNLLLIQKLTCVVRRFNINGLLRLNEILGEHAFNPGDWKIIGEFVYDGEGCRHQVSYSPLRDFSLKDIHFRAGERVLFEQSFKYSAAEAAQMWEAAGLNEAQRWSASSDSYSKSFIILLSFPIFCTQTRTEVCSFTVVRSHDWMVWGTPQDVSCARSHLYIFRDDRRN